MRGLYRIVVLGAVLLGVSAPLAFAVSGHRSTQQSILQDDNQLLYSPPAHVVKTLHKLKALGVDVVKVSMVWRIIAPDATSTHKPNFDATNPTAYPPGVWNRYDLLAETTHKLGMKLFLQFAAKDPVWAADKTQPQGQGSYLGLGQVPNLQYFQQFVQAVGRRFNGTAKDVHGKTIPGVKIWSIWNEPNWRGWLNPWRKRVHGRVELLQPVFYRGLVNTAWKALSGSGHGHDTILLGETANVGSVHPLPFVEDLYCVDSRYKPLTGSAAQTVGCPKTANRSKFVAQNPGLFHVTGYAHHPYGFDIPPSQPKRNKSEVSVADIDRLENVLNGVFGGYHKGRRGGIPLYITEWGYVTNPPNPAYRTTLKEQAAWLDEGEYITWNDPYIKALAQFLLVDVKPPAHPTLRQWKGVFDSGLEFANGSPKPSLAAYRLPIWLPKAHHGPKVTVWGQLRPANHHRTQHGVIQFQRKGTSKWTRLHRLQTGSTEGFVFTHVSIGRPGRVRLGWEGGHKWYYSRSVTVS
ncbi:MAG: hypothetical protein ACJ764_14305 [Solirubrobacteraceae bacterium]